MVAQRSRLPAVGLVIMLFVAGVPALLPTASAAAGTGAISAIQIVVGDTEATASVNPLVRIDTLVSIRVHGNLTVPDGDCRASLVDDAPQTTPRLWVNASLTAIGGPAAEPMHVFFHGNTTGTEDQFPWIAWLNFTARPGGLDRVVAPLAADFHYNCGDATNVAGGGVSRGTTSRTSTPQILVDNVAPSVTATLAPAAGSTAGIGDSVRLTVSASSGVLNGTYDVRQIDPTLGTNGVITFANAPATQTYTLKDTGFEMPRVWVNVTDASGNHAQYEIVSTGVDAQRPPAPTVTATPVNGPAVTFSASNPGNDFASFDVNVSRAGAANVTLACPSAACVADGAGFRILPNVVVSNRSHTLSFAARDETGNRGPWTHGVQVTTLREAAGNMTLTLDKGTGGAGTVVRLAWNASEVVDVDRLTIHAPNLTANLAPENASSFTFTVGATGKMTAWIWVNMTTVRAPGDEVVRAANIWHPDRSGVRNFTFFDTIPPVAPDSLAARAQQGGHVLVDVGAPADADLRGFRFDLTCKWNGCSSAANHSVYYNLTAGQAPGTVITGINLTRDNFTGGLGLEWDIVARPIDQKDNLGPVSPVAATIPGDAPFVITLTDSSFATKKVIRDLLPIGGTYAAPNGLDRVYLSLRNDTSGRWWTGGAPTDAASWKVTPDSTTEFAVTRDAGAAGNWRNATDLCSACAANLNALTTSAGENRYSLVATIVTSEGATLSVEKRMLLDNGVPTLADPTLAGSIAGGFQQGTGPVRVNVAVTDVGPSGLKEVTLQLINATGSGIAWRTDTNAPVAPFVTTISGPSFTGTIPVTLPLLELKDYRFRVTVTDNATNSPASKETPLIRLQPRVAVSGADHGPSASADGLKAYLYAAYDGLRTVQPAGSCTSEFTCRVTQVELYGRNRTQTGDGFLLATYNIPLPSAPAPIGGTAKYYDYSPTGLITDLKGLNREDMYVRGVAKVSVQGTATQVVNMTPWVRVATDALPSGLAVQTPANSTTVFMSGAVGTVNLNVTYDRVALEAPPVINYTVKVLHDRADATRVGKYVRVDIASSTTCSVVDSPPTVSITGRRLSDAQHDFNFTNACRLPAGEYLLNATVRESVGGAEILSTTRFFAVESASPTVVNVDAGTEIYREGYTRQQFKLQLRVDHGYANLSADGVVLTLDTFGAAGFRTLHKGGAEGFDYTIHNVTQMAGNQSSTVNLTVTLPAAAAHDSRYDLRVNATTGSFWTQGALTGGVPAKVTRVSSIIVDARAPTAQTTASASNATGSPRTSELRISGTAQDSGAGVGAVEVRIINLNLSQTFVWDGSENGAWVAGVLDSQRAWLTSDLVRPSGASTDYARNVHVVPTSSPTLVGWVVNNTNRVRHFDSGAVNATSTFAPIGLDRNYTYQVDVRARDLLGSTGPQQTSFVSFDVQAPTVGGPTPVGDAADSRVDWHGTGGINVEVTEDNCVRRVTLVGIRPDGENATPVNFARPAGATCTASAGGGAHTWTLDLSQHTVATHLVGAYDYRVEVEDSAGKVVRSSQNITLVVVDNVQAKVRHLYLEPPTVGANTRSRIVAEIEEFGEIDRVVAIFERLEGTTTTLIAQGNMSLLPAATNRTTGNGTYWFVAETDTHLNVTELPVGNYLWTIRPRDVALGCLPNGCHQLSALVRVTAEAAPVIQLDSPSANAEWINRTPTFQWRVFNYDGGLNGLTLLVGNHSDNMSETNVTSVSAITTTSGNVTGAVVTYSPTLTEEGNYSVRLRAVSTTGFANTTNVLTFRADITPPNVTSNVTGTVEFNNETYGVAATRIALAANDTLSGVSGITYRINGGSPRAYTSPVAISGDDGDWTLTWTATDVAGNKATGTVELKVDVTGPEIRVAEPGDDLLLVVEDKGVGAVGVNETTVVVYYAYGDAPAFSQMEATRETTNSYRVNLGGNASAVGLRYYVVARDLFNNLGTLGSEADPEEIEKDDQLPPPPPPPENTPPVVVIVRPVAGAQVRGEVIFQWEATDADGDELEVNLALQVPNGPSETLRNGAESSGTLTFNLSRKAAGPYTFVVVASDSEDTTTAQVTFSVLAPQDVTVVTPPPVSAVAGDAIQLAVRVNQQINPVANVTYVITRGGETYETGPMAKQGDMYTATFVVPDEAGEYASSIEVAYSDGAQTKSFPMGSTTVTAGTGVGPGPSGGVSIGFIVLLVLGVLTIGLSAGGAFWRWRK